MGEFLAKLPRFALEAEETFDEIPDGQLRRQLTNVRRVALERPNRLAADATGERVWRLPADDDYKDLFKSKIADLKNTGRGATLSAIGYEHLTRPKSYHFKRL